MNLKLIDPLGESEREHGTGVKNRVRPTGVVSSETGDSMFVRDTRSRGSYIIGIVFSGRETFSERVRRYHGAFMEPRKRGAKDDV